MSKKSHAKHEHAQQVQRKHHNEDAAIEPDFPQEHRTLMIVILVIFTIMSTFVFAFFYLFG